MSELESFCESDEWRTNLKKLFLTERKPITNYVTNNIYHAYGLNITDDILKQTSQPNHLESKIIPTDDMKSFKLHKGNQIKNKVEEFSSHDDSDDISLTENLTLTLNETFETLEQMCNENVLDPKSTSFNCLPTNKNKFSGICKKDIDCLKSEKSQQLHYHHMEKRNLTQNGSITIIEEIEAPSELWDKTIANETIVQSLPINKSNVICPTMSDENDISNMLPITSVSKQESYETFNESSDYMTAVGNNSDNTSDCIGRFPESIHNNKDDKNIYISSENIDGECKFKKTTTDSITEGFDKDESIEGKSIRCNKSKSCKVDNIPEDSLKFDNTMEEIDYILQKGLQSMNPSKSQLNVIKNKKSNKENDQDSEYILQSEMGRRHIIDIKQIPKFDLFRKPNSIPKSTISRRREFSDKPFDHITSPISAYIKKTGITPLLATIKSSNNKIDIHNSTIFRKLDYESSQLHNNIGTSNINVENNLHSALIGMHSLPKKTYISAQFKHVINEGTNVNIPGGRNIQKYLKEAKLPAIVRHDGKVKMHREINEYAKFSFKDPTGEKSSNSNIHVDLSDLSFASGDVSLYTIRDAQKF